MVFFDDVFFRLLLHFCFILASIMAPFCHFGASKSIRWGARFQDGLQETCRTDFGSIWVDLGWIWGGFGKVLERFLEYFGEVFWQHGRAPKSLDVLTNLLNIPRLLGVSLKRDPRAAPRSVTMRGGLLPSVVGLSACSFIFMDLAFSITL